MSNQFMKNFYSGICKIFRDEILTIIKSSKDLSDIEKMVLYMRISSDKDTYQELKKLLDTPINTIKQIEYKGIRKLVESERLRILQLRFEKTEIELTKEEIKDRMKIGKLYLFRIDYTNPDELSYSVLKKLEIDLASSRDKGKNITFVLSKPSEICSSYRIYPIPFSEIKEVKTPGYIFRHSRTKVVEEFVTLLELSPKVSIAKYHHISKILEEIENVLDFIPRKGESSSFLYIEPKQSSKYLKNYQVEKIFIQMEDLVNKIASLVWWLPYWYMESLVIPSVVGSPFNMPIIINSRAMAKEYKSDMKEFNSLIMPDIINYMIKLLRYYHWTQHRIYSLSNHPFAKHTSKEYFRHINFRHLELRDLVEFNHIFTKNYEEWEDLYLRGKNELDTFSKESKNDFSSLNIDYLTKRNIEPDVNRYGLTFLEKAKSYIQENFDELKSLLEKTNNKQRLLSSYIQNLLSLKLSQTNINIQKSTRFFTIVIFILTIVIAALTLLLSFDIIKNLFGNPLEQEACPLKNVSHQIEIAIYAFGLIP